MKVALTLAAALVLTGLTLAALPPGAAARCGVRLLYAGLTLTFWAGILYFIG